MSNRTKRGLQSPVLKPEGGARAVVAQGVAKETERKRVIVRPIVVKYLSENLGVPVHIDDMVQLTGAEKSSVQAAMGVLINEGKLRIDTVVGGNTWIYRGPKSVEEIEAAMPEAFRSLPVRPVGSKQIYTELGTNKAGEKILEDEEGTLWRATEL